MNNQSVNTISLIKYAFFGFTIAFGSLPIYLHSPEFYSSEFQISITQIGFTLLVLRLIDAFQDPLIGYLSDIYSKSRSLIIILGVVLMGIGFFMLFNPITNPNIIWFGFSVFIASTGFSIAAINYQAVGGLWKSSSTEKTIITSWREAFALIGILTASALPALLGSQENAQEAFRNMVFIFITIVIISSIVFYKTTQNIPLVKPKHASIKTLLKNIQTWDYQFLILYFINNLASSIPAVLVIFFINDRIGAEGMTGLFLILYFLSGALFMPLWNQLAKKLSKFYAWSLSILLASITFIWAGFLSLGDINAYAIVCVLSGIALGADLSIPPSILADRIKSSKIEGLASMYFSSFAFLSKFALALATGITLPLLGFWGYEPGNITNYEVTEYLSYTYAFLPSVIKLLVGITLFSLVKNRVDWRY